MPTASFFESWTITRCDRYTIVYAVDEFPLTLGTYIVQTGIRSTIIIRPFTSTLVLTSHKINTCSVFWAAAYLCASRVSVAPRSTWLGRRCNITTKVLVKFHNISYLSSVLFCFILYYMYALDIILNIICTSDPKIAFPPISVEVTYMWPDLA